MTRILERALIAGVGTLCLATAACGSRDVEGSKEVRQVAKAIDGTYEAQADLVEATSRHAPDQAVAKQQAEALRDKGDAIKAHFDKEAQELQRDTRALQ
jgi:hypothetical protein